MPDETTVAAAREPSGLARIALRLVGHAESLGVERGELLADARFPEAYVADPDARVPLSALESLWRSLIERVPDGAHGLALGLSTRVRDVGLVGYAMAHSETLGAALMRLSRYCRIVSEGSECQLQRAPEGMRITLVSQTMMDVLAHPAAARLAGLVAACRELAGSDLVPLAVEFPYKRPGRVHEHDDAFVGSRLVFDCPTAAVLLRASDLARPLPTADPTLVRYLDSLAEHVVAGLRCRFPGLFSRRVAEVAWPSLESPPLTVAAATVHLGLSRRTVQRRLREEGTSFATLVDRLRHDHAVTLLRDPKLTIEDIARLLGYRDPSTFYRAFRRWRGGTPTAFRTRLS